MKIRVKSVENCPVLYKRLRSGVVTADTLARLIRKLPDEAPRLTYNIDARYLD